MPTAEAILGKQAAGTLRPPSDCVICGGKIKSIRGPNTSMRIDFRLGTACENKLCQIVVRWGNAITIGKYVQPSLGRQVVRQRVRS